MLIYADNTRFLVGKSNEGMPVGRQLGEGLSHVDVCVEDEGRYFLFSLIRWFELLFY